jgi:hypothetical protein
MECHRESEWDQGSWADEVYALFVTAGWGPEGNCNPWVSVQKTRTYTDVDTDEKHGADDPDDNRTLWGVGDAYGPMNIYNQLILVQAMEHDDGSEEGIRKALEKVMIVKLKSLLNKNASREEIKTAMKESMKKTVDAFKDIDGQWLSFLNDLSDAALENLVGTSDFDDIWDFINVLLKIGTAVSTGGTSVLDDLEELALDTIEISVTRLFESGDDRIGGPQQLTITRTNIASALSEGTVRKYLTFDGGDEGKYEFKFSVYAQE